MTTSTPLLTLAEFEHRYAHQDKAYEFWFGEAVPKAMPTILHGITQKIICFLLDRLGYFTSVEVDLHIHPDWRPRPDVLASTHKFERPYPTRPDNLFVIEVLSPDDRWGQVRSKCKYYEQLTHIETIYLLDPDSNEGWRWNAARRDTERIDSLLLPRGESLDLSVIWEQVKEQL